LRDDDVVARVNATPIYRKSVREVVQGALLEQEKQPDPDTIGTLAGAALDSLIDFELLYQESQARSVTVSDAAVDQEIARTKSKFPDSRSFDKVLKAKGMTEDALRRDTRKTMAVNRLLEGSVFKDAQVPDAQIKDFYERNKEEFKHPAQTRASHILIRVPENAPASERDSAKKTAAALLAQLQAGTKTCSALSAGDLDHIGEYVMFHALGSTTVHQAMNDRMRAMMGDQGESRMHQLLGARYAGCTTSSSGAGVAGAEELVHA